MTIIVCNCANRFENFLLTVYSICHFYLSFWSVGVFRRYPKLGKEYSCRIVIVECKHAGAIHQHYDWAVGLHGREEMQ
jgi:hypothetical protein